MDRPISLSLRSVDLANEPAFQLGSALVDPQAHECVIGDTATHLQPQTLKVLVALHDKSGHVVTREELIDRCWNGRIVGDDVINRCISLLRPLAAQSGGFRIETIPRSGYRLIEFIGTPSRKSVWLAPLGVIAIACLAAGTWLWVDRDPVRQGLPPAPSVTVVPFTVESNDAVEHAVADGAPVSIAHMLSESGFPIVLGRSAAPDAATSDFVITGNVRRIPGSVQVTVQMNATSDGTMVFSHNFDAAEARSADLPDQIGAVFASDLAWTGAEMLLDRRQPLDRQIASELMNAMTLTVEHSDVLRAYQITRRIAPMAPNSAIAQLSLAVDTGFSISAIPRDDRQAAVATARQAAARALALAPEFGDVYIPGCVLQSPVRMGECEARLRRAMQIDPSSSFVPGYLGSLLFSGGRLSEAVDLARVSLANDPYKPAKLARMIQMLEISGRNDEAQALFENATRLWPDNRPVRSARVIGLAEAADLQGIAKLVGEPGPDGLMIDGDTVTSLLAAIHDRDVGRARQACHRTGLKPLTQPLCMTSLAAVGDVDGAFALAAELYPKRVGKTAAQEDAIWLDDPDGTNTAYLTLPATAPMRRDPRCLTLAERTGLLSYWRSGRLPDFCTQGHEPVCARIAAR